MIKILSLGVILLFVGLALAPSIGGDVEIDKVDGPDIAVMDMFATLRYYEIHERDDMIMFVINNIGNEEYSGYINCTIEVTPLFSPDDVVIFKRHRNQMNSFKPGESWILHKLVIGKKLDFPFIYRVSYEIRTQSSDINQDNHNRAEFFVIIGNFVLGAYYNFWSSKDE